VELDLRFAVQLGLIGLAFFMLINATAVLVLAERTIMGFMQQRYGPYLVGPYGLLVRLSVFIMLLLKVVVLPKGAV
jgi:NADH-quinone oxidoreductase subunit H